MKVSRDKNKIKEILERGVDKVIERKHLEKKLLAGKKLKLYYGIDPTSPLLHLGHAIVLRKLQAFASLGHQVILLIGDFTARIGDPTDKEAVRKPLSEKQVKENMKTYKAQAGKILNFSKVEIKYNSQWLSKLNFGEVLKLAGQFSVFRMLERDMFKKRMKEKKTIGLHEFLYPLMQGYDSVALNVDLEIAGSDQLFNMLAGRDLQKIYHDKNKDVLTTRLLPGLDGRKMSKTYGNFIALTSEPQEMYGKIMSMADGLIGDYFELCANLPMTEVKKMKEALKAGKGNPRELKGKLAREIVQLYHGEKAAQGAEQNFNRVFRDKQLPEKMPVFKTKQKSYQILDLIKDSGLADSKAQAKRLVLGKAVKIRMKGNDRLVKDWQEKIKLENGLVLQAGKRKFVKIELN